METVNRTSRNLDTAISKIYDNEIALSCIMVTKEKYYLVFLDESTLEIIHDELHDNDLNKMILLLEEANHVIHPMPISSEDLQQFIQKYFKVK
jgi:hypothetical protein